MGDEQSRNGEDKSSKLYVGKRNVPIAEATPDVWDYLDSAARADSAGEAHAQSEQAKIDAEEAVRVERLNKIANIKRLMRHFARQILGIKE